MGTKTTKRLSLNTIAAAIAYLVDRGVSIRETVDGPAVAVSLACPRCGGEGRGHWFPDGGICYECNGAKTAGLVDLVPVVDFAKAERRRELAAGRRQAAAEKRAEAALERQRAWCESQGHGPVTFAELDEIRRQDRASRAAASDFVGTEGERRVFDVRLEATFSWAINSYSGFGTTTVTLYKFRDADGNAIVWKTTGVGLWKTAPAGNGEVPIGKGDEVRIRGTVKSHSTYKGEKQTEIARAALVK